MTSSVSLRPVMKMTGTWLSSLCRLRRRQISKPSIPGITASIRITSGVMRSISESACSPSSATRTVMPAPSMASVSIRNVLGESSTTRMILRGSCLAMADPERLEDGHVTFEIEAICEYSHVSDEIPVRRGVGVDRGQLVLDSPHVADAAHADQLLDVPLRGKWLGPAPR